MPSKSLGVISKYLKQIKTQKYIGSNPKHQIHSIESIKTKRVCLNQQLRRRERDDSPNLLQAQLQIQEEESSKPRNPMINEKEAKREFYNKNPNPKSNPRHPNHFK